MDRRKIGRPWITPRTPEVEAVLHRGGRHAIHQVFVGGELVVDEGRAVKIDRDAVMAEVKARLGTPETAAELEAWSSIDALIPILEEHHRRSSMPDTYRSYRFNAMNDAE
jgi:5-methylthioadenosine/S-adenosylhomocysteine deaminase